MRTRLGLAFFVLLSICFVSSVSASIVVHTSDFIANGTRSCFNGFEAIPIAGDGIHFSGGGGPYAEGGITVEQIGGDAGNDIWVKYFFPEGINGWYPDGGDFGFTRITKTDGSDFVNLGMTRGTGYFADSKVAFDVRLNGVSQLTGTLFTPGGGAPVYLGFDGMPFDEVLLADAPGIGFVGDGSLNAFAVDEIEVGSNAVPEPSSFALLGLGVVALCGYGWRKRK